MIKKLKIPCHGHVLLVMLNGEEIVGTFYKTELQKKTNQKEFRVKRKGDKLYVKCKGYNSSFNSLVDKRTYYK